MKIGEKVGFMDGELHRYDHSSGYSLDLEFYFYTDGTRIRVTPINIAFNHPDFDEQWIGHHEIYYPYIYIVDGATWLIQVLLRKQSYNSWSQELMIFGTPPPEKINELVENKCIKPIKDGKVYYKSDDFLR